MFITDLLGARQDFRPNVSKALLSESLHFSDREGGEETREGKRECPVTTRKNRKAEQSDRVKGYYSVWMRGRAGRKGGVWYRLPSLVTGEGRYKAQQHSQEVLPFSSCCLLANCCISHTNTNTMAILP